MLLSITPSSSCEKNEDRRNCGRLRTEQLDTDIGRVVNLSGSGMRITSRRSFKEHMGEIIELALTRPGLQKTVKGKVVWTQRAGFRKHLVGIRFVELAESDRSQLTQLAQAAVFLPGLGNQNVRKNKQAA